MISLNDLKKRHEAIYGGESRIFSAPGRVNLIGEHTDYNDGFVLPMAIDRRTYVSVSAGKDRIIRCRSTGFDGEVIVDLNQPIAPASDWGNHVRGVAANLVKEEYELVGANILIDGEVPLGAGLSSSAALEVAIGYGLLQLADEPVDPVDLAVICQRAEQEFTGTQCGIMDQYIACLGIADHALLIDCRSLDYRAVKMESDKATIVVCNSMVRHDLASGEYNIRRAECEEGVKRLSGYHPGLKSLRDLEIEEFDHYADTLPEKIMRRCNHVITENARTLAAVEALKKGELLLLGRLFYASHESLRDDYQVSCDELDLLVDLASKIPGCYGARMTGGGFGGCTVNLVATDQTENFVNQIQEKYAKLSGITPECYPCRASNGVRED
ncbi:MAG: galactokinase [Acidobacteria bacterium]|nr:galactokinase [Acidobacteriota bacterium]